MIDSRYDDLVDLEYSGGGWIHCWMPCSVLDH